jgi:phosphonate transport system ATP-binding protein
MRPAAAPPLFQIDALHKRFGAIHALRGIDLRIDRGEGVVLLGPNGSGKTTLLRCLNGLETPDGGTVSVGGLDPARCGGAALRGLRRRIGVVFQRFHLVGTLSALQNTLFGALGRETFWRVLAPTAPQHLRIAAMECLDRVGLAAIAGQRADTLSGGQQQRVAIARMLMQAPEIVLADEPIASLDPVAGREVMDLLWSVVRERGLTVICTLHQLDAALAYADRIVALRAGRVALDAPAAAIDRAALEAIFVRETAA